MSKGYVLELDHPDGTVEFGPDDFDMVDLPFEHTTANEWEIQTPHANRARGYELADATFYYQHEDGSQTLIYDGVFDFSDGDPDGSVQTLRGQDVTAKLKQGGESVTYENTATHEAIQDYWDEYTDWDAAVSEPTVSTVDEDLTIMQLISNAELEGSFGEIEADVPLAIRNDSIELLQSGWVFEVEDFETGTQPTSGTQTDDSFSGGEAEILADVVTFYEFSFETEYEIEFGDLEIALRSNTIDAISVTDVNIDGQFFSNVPTAPPTGGLEWDTSTLVDSNSDYSPDDVLEPGSHTITLEVRNGDGEIHCDVLAIYDSRHGPYTLDNSVHEPSGYLDGPELYPDSIVTPYSEEASSTYNIEEATVIVGDTAFDGLGGILVYFSGKGAQSDYVGGSSTITSQPPNPTTTVQIRLLLGRNSPNDAQDATPRYGYEGQTVYDITINVDTSDLSVIEDKEFTGSHYSNLTELHEDANMAFVPEFDESSTQSVESFVLGEETASADWETLEGKSLKRDLRDYANSVTVFGATDEETDERIEETIENQDEIAEKGLVEAEPIFDTGIESRASAISTGRSELQSRINEDRDTGSIPIVPKIIEPGKTYYVPEFDENLILESVTFTDGKNPSGDLEFGQPRTLERLIGQQSRDLNRTKTSIR